MNEGAPLVHLDYVGILQAFREIARSADERTVIVDNVPVDPARNNAHASAYEDPSAVAYALLLGNMNSLPLDWAARIFVGGVHMSFFIVKQLPVLRPDTYLKASKCGPPWVELIVPRVLELTHTAHDLNGFARAIGYRGSTFTWREERRHCLRCELDAIFAHIYALDRSDLEWILDAAPPSSSFPTLKQLELKEFGEYRTQRYVLEAYDALSQGEIPMLNETVNST